MMKRLPYLWILMALPFIAFTATERAQISLNVVATDPLSYNVRPLPSIVLDRNPEKSQNQILAKNNSNISCKKTVYLNNIPYQITAMKQQVGFCTIDHLGGQSYGIMMRDV